MAWKWCDGVCCKKRVTDYCGEIPHHGIMTGSSHTWGYRTTEYVKTEWLLWNIALSVDNPNKRNSGIWKWQKIHEMKSATEIIFKIWVSGLLLRHLSHCSGNSASVFCSIPHRNNSSRSRTAMPSYNYKNTRLFRLKKVTHHIDNLEHY